MREVTRTQSGGIKEMPGRICERRTASRPGVTWSRDIAVQYPSTNERKIEDDCGGFDPGQEDL